MTTKSRVTITVAACFVALLGAGLGTWAVVDRPDRSTAAEVAGTKHTTTAPVTRGDLTESRILAGTLGYGAPVGVPGAAQGTITALPDPGQVIHRDEQLYAVDERSIRSMWGTVPLWRTLEYGREGTDVEQLNHNLAALGYDVVEDDVFGRRTAAAVRQWQRDRALDVTGTITADDIAFVDGDVRVASVPAKLGQPANGDVLEVTSTKRVVTASVPPTEADRLPVGTKTQVRVNGTGEPLGGTVIDAQPAEQQGQDGAAATVDVRIAIEPGERELPSAASAQVTVVGRTERDVLSVPVSALVAGTEAGEFAVDVVARDETRRVPVQVGFVADGRVVVQGVDEGDRVVVPS